MSTLPKTFIPPEKYLDLDRAAEYKSEYYDGEMFAMAGAPALSMSEKLAESKTNPEIASLARRARESRIERIESPRESGPTAQGAVGPHEILDHAHGRPGEHEK